MFFAEASRSTRTILDPPGLTPGTYRIYHGLAKRLLASDLPFTGTSRPFEVADR